MNTTSDPFPDPFRKVGSLQGSSPVCSIATCLMDKAQQLSLIEKFDVDFTSANQAYRLGSKKIFYLQTLELTDDYEGSQQECQGYIEEIKSLRVDSTSLKEANGRQHKEITSLEEELVKVRSRCDQLLADNKEGAQLITLKENQAQQFREEADKWESLATSVRRIPLLGEETLSYQSDLALRWDEHMEHWNDLVSDFQNKYCPTLGVWIKAVMKAIDSLIRRVKSVEIS